MLKLFGLRARRRLCCTFGLVLALTAGWVAPAAADGIEPISTIEPSSTIEPLATEDVTGSTDDVALLGHWDFEDSSAPGLDSSAAGRHGTLQGNASLVRGRMAGDRGFEQALAFDGASYLTVPNQGADLNGLATVTVAAWLRVPSHRQTNVFRIQQPLALNSDGFSVANYATGGGWQSLVASEAPPVDRWYHLVAVFDHGEMRLYLDGAKVASRSVAFGSLQGTAYDVWSFGARWVEGAADQFLRGTLDDLRIYGRALDSDEIEVLGFRHQEPFQLGAWTFDDETEPGRDVSGAERHALLVGEVDLTRGRIQANGFASGALRLDGAGHLEIPAPGVDLGGLEQFTVEAWVSTAEGPSPNVFRAQTPAALDSQAFDVWSATTGWSAVTASLAPDDDRWHHIAGVFDRGEARFYLNGRLVDVDNLGSPAPGPDAADVWAIGARVGAGVLDQHFAGAIDEVRLWSGALTHLEVAQRASQIILPATEPQAASGGLCSPPPVACGEAEACVAEAVASCERATANHCLPPVSPKCGSCLVKLISGRGFPYIRLAECFTSCGVGPLIEFIDCRGGAMRDLVNEAYGCNCFLCSGEPCPSPYDVRVQAAGLRFDEVATFGVACEGGGSAAPELVRVSGSHPSSAVFCQAEETWQVTQAGVFDANLGTYLRSCSPSTRTGTGSPGTVVDVDFDCHCDDDCDPPGRPLTVEACLPEDFNNSISVATRVTGPAGEDLGIARTTLSRAGTFDLGLTAPVGSTYSDAEIGPSPSGFFCFADQYPGNTVAGGLPDGQPVLVARVVCHPAGGSATDCNGLIDGHRLFGLARPLRGDPAPSPTVQIQVSRPDGTVKTSRGTAFAEGQFSLHVKAPQGSTWQAELVSSDECILNPESGVINQPGSNDLTLLHVACVPTHEKYETVNFVLDPDPLALGYPWGWGGLADCRHVCPLAPTVQPLDCRPIIDPVTGIILGEVCEVTAEHCKIVCTDENLGPAAFFSVAGTRAGNRITADTELQISGRAEDDDGIKGFSFYITRATTPEQIELTAYRPSSGVFSDYALDTSGLTEG
ncbi:MAG: LamG domain-containing protein, partial [Acidobacteriota bacterium]